MAKFMELSKNRQEKLSDFLGRYEISLSNLIGSGLVVDVGILIYVLTRTLSTQIKDGVRLWRTINKEGTIEDLISYIRVNFREEDAARDANNAAFFGSNKFKTNNYKSQYKGNKKGGNKASKTNNLNCTYCKKQGHSWQSCFKLKKDNEAKKYNKERANMALERSYLLYQQYLPNNENNRWVIDSGATSHMTYVKEVLMNYTEFEVPKEILVGDGEHIQAEGKGWIFMHGENGAKVLKNVLYVPRMAANLFSVKAALQEGYRIEFSGNSVKVEHEGETIPAHYDGCLFSIRLRILNRFYKKNEALTAYSLESWHKRLGHCGVSLIKRLQKEKMVNGLEIGSPRESCEDCIQGKSCRKPHPTRTQIKASKDYFILHFDTVDTSVESLGGARYFVLGTEEYSGYKLIDFVAHKSEIKNSVKLMINSVALNSKRPVVCIYTDNGSEFINHDLKEWLSERGIIHELSSAYNAEQNGRAEASNKTVINGARTSLVSSGLPKTLWAEACSACVYVLNRLPSLSKPNITRYELYYREKPDVSNLHEFGEYALRLTPKQLRKNKLDPIANRYRFVGYTSRFNTYRLYDEELERIIIDCNVRFTNRTHVLKNQIPQENYATIRWEKPKKQSQHSNSQGTLPRVVHSN